MIRRMCDFAITAIIAGVLYAGCLTPVEAQNVTCATRPVGDQSNACASTEFVFQNSVSPFGTAGYAFIANGLSTPASFQGFIQAGTGALTRTWQDKGRDQLSAADYLSCDGVTDEYAKLTQLVARAQAIGADIYIPGGCKIAVPMTGGRTAIDVSQVRFRGASAPYYPAGGGYADGAWILITGTSDSPFACYYDCAFWTISWVWPDQVDPATPIAYPAAIRAATGLGIGGAEIAYNKVVNAYVFVDYGTNTGLNYTFNNSVTALSKAFTAGESHAETYFNDNNISYAAGYTFYNDLGKLAQLTTRVRGFARGIDLTGVGYDAWTIANNTIVGQSSGIYFDNASEAYFWGSIVGNQFDGNSVAILFLNKARPALATISGNVFNSGPSVGVAFRYHIAFSMTGATAYSAAISANLFADSEYQQISITSNDPLQPGTVTLSGNMHGQSATAGDRDGIYIDSTLADVAISGNTFDIGSLGTSRAVVIVKANNATISGNTLKTSTVGILTTTVGGKLTLVGNTATSSVGTPVSLGTTTGQLVNYFNSWNTYTSGSVLVGAGLSGVTLQAPGALTKVDDTNVTLTLGGTPATALLQATSLTLGWTGTLAAGRLNSNVVQAVTNDTNVTGSIAAQNLTLGWTGRLAFSRLTQGSALSVLGVAGNATADNASIAAASDHQVMRRSGTAIAFGSIDLSQSGAVGSSILGVANGGTGLASGTSGGILCYTASGTIASSSAMTANYIIKGGGAGACPIISGVTIGSDDVLSVPNLIIATAPNSSGVGLQFRGRASDNLGDMQFTDNSGSTGYSFIRTTSTAGGTLQFYAAGATLGLTLNSGAQIGSPTGGDKGSGTLNVATNYYINGTVGLTAVKTVRDSAGTGTCTITFTSGLATASTC